MNVRKIVDILVISLILLLPLTHKEHFSFFLPDLTYVKFILVPLAIYGVFKFLSKPKDIYNDPYFVFLLGIVFFQILSLFVTRDVISTLEIIVFQLSISFTYIAIKEFIFDHNITTVWKIYSLSFVSIFIFLLVQMYFQVGFSKSIGGIWPLVGHPTRYGSVFWDVNHFGAYLSSLFLLFLGFLFYFYTKGNNAEKLNKYKVITYLLMCFMLFALYLTGSRSAFVGFLAGIVVFIYLFLKNNVRLKNEFFSNEYLINVLLVISPAVIVGCVWVLKDMLKNVFLYRGISFFAHLFLLKIGFTAGMQNWIFGVGANAFYAYFNDSKWADSYRYIDPSSFKLPLHSIWLEAFTETGLVSFLFVIVTFSFLVFRLFNVYKKDNDYVALGFLGGLVSFFVGGLMYSYKAEFFWIYVLLSMAYSIKRMPFKGFGYSFFKKNVFSDRYKLANDLIVIISIIGIVWPILFIFEPITFSELHLRFIHIPILSGIYLWILDLFYYVFGMYSYVGRLVSFMFYIFSILSMYLFFRKYSDFKSSLLAISVFVNFYGSYKFVMSVSPFWFYVFIIFSILLFIPKVSVEKKECRNSKFAKYNDIISLLAMVFIVLLPIYNNIRLISYTTKKDLSFFVELAYNKTFLSNSLVDYSGLNGLDKSYVEYYCQDVVLDGYHFNRINVCMFGDGSKIGLKPKAVVFSDKRIRNKSKTIMEDAKKSGRFNVNLLENKDYMLLLIEAKKK